MAVRANCDGLTPRQCDTLHALSHLTASLGYPPTMTELGKELGISATRVSTLVKELRAKGRVTWEDGKQRTLRVTEGGQQ